MRRSWLLVLLAACGDDGGTATPDARRAIDAPREIDAPANACPGGKTLFLNRAGGTYVHGDADDATTNTASIVEGTQTLAPWPYDDTSWQAMKDCITTGLAPFRVTVTDVDPGTVPHHEIAFTTKYWVQAESSYMYAISAAACAGPPASGLAFVFGNPGGLNDPTAKKWCDTALSQFASDIAGLDHSRDCNDFLGEFLPACGPMRSYVDAEVKCGENMDRACFCGGTTQNSYQKMKAVLCQ